jgi:hypothetical protein
MSPEADPPHRIDQSDGSFTVPAEILASAFALLPADIPRLMREGQITSRLEQGQDADAGTHRLTFYHAAQALRLIIDADGWIVKRSRFPVTRRTP